MSNKIESLKDCIVSACNEILPMFGLEYKFLCELPESTFNSAEEINILAGLTQNLNGSIVIGMPKKAALKIISAMMGGMEVAEMDMMAKSAICELTNMLAAKIAANAANIIGGLVDISTPTLITGENMMMMISKVPSKKVFFKFGDTKFNISYALE